MRTNTFTHDGVEYDLDYVLEKTRYLPIETFKLSELKWLIDEIGPPTDVRYPNLTRPILVVPYEGKVCCVDGYHRIWSALERGWEYLGGRWVSEKVLEEAKILKVEESTP